MFGAFDVNKDIPGGEDTILKLINSSAYANPEAAQADFEEHAPRAMDYLKDQYQRATGDWFADPFKDASDARARTVSDAALAGAPIIAGSQQGSRIMPGWVPPDCHHVPLILRFYNFQLARLNFMILVRFCKICLRFLNEQQTSENADALMQFLSPETRKLVSDRQSMNYRLADQNLQLHNAVDPATGQVDSAKLRNLILQRANIS